MGSSILSLPPYANASTHRLQALYSDISRQKHSNPTSYHSNVEWWRAVLELVVSMGLQTGAINRLVLTAGQPLMEVVRVQGVGKPLALGAVVTELCASRVLITRGEFMKVQQSIYDPGWLPTRIASFIVGKPLWWALEQMGVVGEDGMLGGGLTYSRKDTAWWGDYVFISLLERAGDAVLEKQYGKVGGVGDRLYSWEDFRQEFGSTLGVNGPLSEADAVVLLKYLERDKNAVLFDKEVVKFLVDDTSVPREINAADRGILELRVAVQNLHAQVDGLQNKMDECTQKASAALYQKRKAIALSHLRLKKQLEDLLSKRLSSLDNLEFTLLCVEAAAGDVEIIKSYESSTSTLRTILAHPSLQKESIEATMNALAEVNADAKEVDEAVRIGADIAIGVDDATIDGELEEELRALVLDSEKKHDQEEQGKEQETRKRLEKASKVPVEVPSANYDTTLFKVALS